MKYLLICLSFLILQFTTFAQAFEDVDYDVEETPVTKSTT